MVVGDSSHEPTGIRVQLETRPEVGWKRALATSASVRSRRRRGGGRGGGGGVQQAVRPHGGPLPGAGRRWEEGREVVEVDTASARCVNAIRDDETRRRGGGGPHATSLPLVLKPRSVCCAGRRAGAGRRGGGCGAGREAGCGGAGPAGRGPIERRLRGWGRDHRPPGPAPPPAPARRHVIQNKVTR